MITFAMDWAFEHHALIEYGNNYCSVITVLLADSTWRRAVYLVSHIANGISFLLVNATIVCGPIQCC